MAIPWEGPTLPSPERTIEDSHADVTDPHVERSSPTQDPQPSPAVLHPSLSPSLPLLARQSHSAVPASSSRNEPATSVTRSPSGPVPPGPSGSRTVASATLQLSFPQPQTHDGQPLSSPSSHRSEAVISPASPLIEPPAPHLLTETLPDPDLESRLHVGPDAVLPSQPVMSTGNGNVLRGPLIENARSPRVHPLGHDDMESIRPSRGSEGERSNSCSSVANLIRAINSNVIEEVRLLPENGMRTIIIERAAGTLSSRLGHPPSPLQGLILAGALFDLCNGAENMISLEMVRKLGIPFPHQSSRQRWWSRLFTKIFPSVRRNQGLKPRIEGVDKSEVRGRLGEVQIRWMAREEPRHNQSYFFKPKMETTTHVVMERLNADVMFCSQEIHRLGLMNRMNAGVFAKPPVADRSQETRDSHNSRTKDMAALRAKLTASDAIANTNSKQQGHPTPASSSDNTNSSKSTQAK